ncbi:hypothetical protein [Nonomuraea sp. NPDC049758]|uniref:hypothetical protein n=1 Tax=Nonomuraea sp. NPDC049758 TaxID=3154360 RepID=UPI0034235910
MTNEQSAAHRAFIAQLNELREQAGSPALAHLRMLSRNPLPNGSKGRELAASTTQEILSGKRRRLPAWIWVASYVSACHQAAQEGNLNLGPMDLETWRTRLLHARRGDQPASASPGRSAVLPATAGPATMLSADHLTAEEVIQCYRDVHGRIAARLARTALDGDAEACFHLALFTLLRGWGHDGMDWLRRAADAGHEAALALQSAPDPRTQAADVAYRHGCALEAGGATRASIARCFYRLAAEIGHPEAIAKITSQAVSPPAIPSAASASDTEHPPRLLDDVCADHFSCRLGMPWPPPSGLSEPVPEQPSTTSAPAVSSRLTRDPDTAHPGHWPAWQSMMDLAGAISTAAHAQVVGEEQTGATFVPAGDDITGSYEVPSTWLLDAQQHPVTDWPDGPLLWEEPPMPWR